MNRREEVVVVSGVRTPFGKFGGTLSDIPSVDLAAMVIKEVLARAKVPGSAVDELYYGFGMTEEPLLDGKGDVPARRALLKAGLPQETISVALNRACCSSLTAVQIGFRAIKLGEANVVVAVGADNMGRTPLFVHPRVRWGSRIGHITLQDRLFELGYADFNPVSKDAGEVALEYGVTREEQDNWAYRSQMRYAKALAEGKFKDELMAVEVPQRKGPPLLFDRDEFPKPQTTLEGLSRLPTIYGSPTVTAGNAPGLDAGAAATLIMKRSQAEKFGLSPLATILSVTSVCMAPRMIAAVPAPAIEKALSVAKLSLDDVDLIEINEAFAAMPLVASKILAQKHYEGDGEKLKQLREKINVNGGCIAIGHPLGASGVRLLVTMAYELRRRGGGLGVCAICGGLAQGDSAVIKVND